MQEYKWRLTFLCKYLQNMIKANKEETHLNDHLEGWFWFRIPIPRCLTPVPPAPPPAPVFPTLPHPQTPRSPVCLPATPAGPGGAVGDTNRKIFQVMSHNLGTTIVPTLHSLGNVTAVEGLTREVLQLTLNIDHGWNFVLPVPKKSIFYCLQSLRIKTLACLESTRPWVDGGRRLGRLVRTGHLPLLHHLVAKSDNGTPTPWGEISETSVLYIFTKFGCIQIFQYF